MLRGKHSQNITNFYTTFTAAQKLYVTPPTIIQWIKGGFIKCIVTPGGHRRIPAEEIERVWKEMQNKRG